MASFITLNYVSLLLSLLVLAYVAPSTSNPNWKLTHELLKRVCLSTGNPTCLRTLQDDPQTQTLNLGNLTLSYVEKARNRASSTLILIENQQTLERELLFKYRRCWTHYKVALRDLSRARQRLKSRNFNIIDLAITAFTRPSDCDDEFEDKKVSIPSELNKSNQELRVFGGIVFGLAKELLLP